MEKTNNEDWPSVRIKRETHDLLSGIKKTAGVSISGYIDVAVKEKMERDGTKPDLA